MSKINTSEKNGVTAGDQLGRDLATAVITFHEAVARKAGMSATERKTLGVLGELGMATPGQLAQATGLTTGAITGIVDRLEKAGYARREANPNDRRSLLIRPLQQEKLGKLLGPAFSSLSASMTTMASRYTPNELDVVARYLADTIAVLKAETVKLKAKQPSS